MRPSVRLSSFALALLLISACGGGVVTGDPSPSAGGGTGTTAPAEGATNDDAGGAGASDSNDAGGGGTVVTPDDTAAASPIASNAAMVFGAYKDVTINANWNTSEISTRVGGSQQAVAVANSNLKLATWSFATGECGSETWGGMTPAALVEANVAAWNAAGMQYMLATGGAAGSFTCSTDAGFFAFLDRYNSAGFIGVDFDIEAGQSAAVIADLVARAKAAQAQEKYKNLRFSFTIATFGGTASPSLNATGIAVMDAIKAGGLKNYYINLMAMNYGSSSAYNCTLNAAGTSCDMGASAVRAAQALHEGYGIPYSQIELTPMIGGNDTVDETFTLQDVTTLVNFAKAQGLGGLHYWSLDRDVDCPSGSASPTCNTMGGAGPWGFLNTFARALSSTH